MSDMHPTERATHAIAGRTTADVLAAYAEGHEPYRGGWLPAIVLDDPHALLMALHERQLRKAARRAAKEV